MSGCGFGSHVKTKLASVLLFIYLSLSHGHYERGGCYKVCELAQHYCRAVPR